jgi:hypothetical protein
MSISEQTLTAHVHYPQDATPINASGTGTAAAQNAVALSGNANQYTFLSKAIVTSQSPAAQVGGVVTISDGTWTLSFQFVETVSAGGFMHLDFGDAPLQASAVNTAITVTIPAISSGAATAIALVGYRR